MTYEFLFVINLCKYLTLEFILYFLILISIFVFTEWKKENYSDLTKQKYDESRKAVLLVFTIVYFVFMILFNFSMLNTITTDTNEDYIHILKQKQEIENK